MKLNGWKRIGIVASVMWVLGAYTHAFNSEYDSTIKTSTLLSQDCFERADGQGEWQLCQKQQDEYIAAVYPAEVKWAALFALVPVPLGWGFVYLVLFIVRWVRHGFSSDPRLS
jgi:hypothetical protein